MAGLFWRQFGILVWKNWIVLSKHPFLNLLRCFILPVAYGVFLAVAQLFLVKPNNNGLGTAIPVPSLYDHYDGSSALVWADGTNGTSSPSPLQIIEHISSGFNERQLKGMRQVATPADVPAECPQNFNLFSECFAAVVFNSIPANGSATSPINYTIRADAGLFHIDVFRHNSDYEQRILPLQWAVDQAIIELKTGVQPPIPLEWPFTQATNEEQSRDIRLSYIRGLRTLLVIALFICFVGIIYQLPGAVAGERASLLTSHMKAMGLMDSARVISWHVSISLAYLPAWVIVGLTWHYRIFTASNPGLILVIHLLLGFSLASWSLFTAAPFGKSPQLAAVVTTFLGIMLAIIALVFQRASTVAAFIYSIIFPPGFYIFAIRAICGFENNLQATNLLQPDPDSGLRLLPLLIAAIIDIFLWPWLAVLLERRLYDPQEPSRKGWAFWRKRSQAQSDISPDTAISVRNLNKTFSTSLLGRSKGLVTAVEDLSFDIPKFGIFVLLGSNGAGKSTSLSIIGGLAGRTSGSITFEGGVNRPPRGTIGIVPQKNVLFDELTCFQTLRLWRAIKRADASAEDEDIEQLLRDCDLESKIHANSATLSGGQKRKLQLAIGLIGNSKIVLVDECTSGVDPLSRRALWRTLSSYRNERTIVFTTHFLDEADLLADHIAILAAPGKLVAQGTPVSLKRDLGEGYTIQVSFSAAQALEKSADSPSDLLGDIRTVLPGASLVMSSPSHAAYHLKSRDPQVVVQVLELIDSKKSQYNLQSYDILGTSIEDIFLDLMAKQGHDPEKRSLDTATTPNSNSASKPLQLDDGRAISPLRQAFIIFHKRALIARRSWLSPLLCVLIAIAGSTIPLVFLSDRQQTCTRTFRNATSIALFAPISPINPIFGSSAEFRVQTSPPGIVSTLGNITKTLRINDLPDNASFVNAIQHNYRNLSLGGVSVDPSTSSSLVAWEASSPGIVGPVMLNLASNILYNRALNTSGRADQAPTLIRANYQNFPAVSAGTLVALKWVAFFGAAMSVFPAFFSLYVCRERRAAVQAMQFSNGLSNPLGLWVGHLMFDSTFVLIIATIVIIVFAAVSNQFNGLGFLWLVLVLYGITGALFSYCISLAMASPLAAFAAVAGYQIVMFLLYIAGYLLTLTYAKTSEAGNIITTIHFTLSVLSPVASIIRAALVSVNLFSLLCDGRNPVTASSMGAITRFGGPILYLIVYSLILMAILVFVDSGSVLRRSKRRSARSDTGARPAEADVAAEEHSSSTSLDLLRVQHISKTFGNNRVVDNVSFGASRDTIFALLGPNGAGKTTTFNVIRGDVWPDTGDVLIDGTSVIAHPRRARLSLGVCPQFTAIDVQLTVREHLETYGRLKGLHNEELRRSVDSLLVATGLDQYADRLASKTSGGNQRKVALAIALIGNPSVILIDEFSTGIDAKMKRDMWGTLRNVALGKAVIITTHSMEEASALANKVGIIAKRMLAVGTTDSLSDRYASYEVHFSCHSREDVMRAQQLMSHIPGAKPAEDVSTRFEVPMDTTKGTSLAQLFSSLAEHGDFTEYTVEKATLESVFLKVIRENNVREDDQGERTRRWFRRRT
ncbi:hypothetical protein HGRIS_008597 [Hohenbuehelia grisea]|uniref:ABC transporter domain-containing protein n=1 Tax=Hohenbuehelia grisea TaxID=104357 RepID=A0ABR3J8F1_9AGAR